MIIHRPGLPSIDDGVPIPSEKKTNATHAAPDVSVEQAKAAATARHNQAHVGQPQPMPHSPHSPAPVEPMIIPAVAPQPLVDNNIAK